MAQNLFQNDGATGAFLDQAGRRGPIKPVLVARARRHAAIRRRLLGRLTTAINGRILLASIDFRLPLPGVAGEHAGNASHRGGSDRAQCRHGGIHSIPALPSQLDDKQHNNGQHGNRAECHDTDELWTVHPTLVFLARALAFQSDQVIAGHVGGVCLRRLLRQSH